MGVSNITECLRNSFSFKIDLEIPDACISEAQAVIRARIESQVNKLERNSETAFIL